MDIKPPPAALARPFSMLEVGANKPVWYPIPAVPKVDTPDALVSPERELKGENISERGASLCPPSSLELPRPHSLTRSLSYSPHTHRPPVPTNTSASTSTTPSTEYKKGSPDVLSPHRGWSLFKPRTPSIPDLPKTDYRKSPGKLTEHIRRLDPYNDISRQQLVQSIQFTSSTYASECANNALTKARAEAKAKGKPESEAIPKPQISGSGLLLKLFDNSELGLGTLPLSRLINLLITRHKESSHNKLMLTPLCCMLAHILLTAREGLSGVSYQELHDMEKGADPIKAYKSQKISYQTSYLAADSTPVSSLVTLQENPEWIDDISPSAREKLIASMKDFVSRNHKPKHREDRIIKDLYKGFLADFSRQQDDIEAIKVEKTAESYRLKQKEKALRKTISRPSYSSSDRSGLNRPA